jgi:CO dehydrogenase nickel-insertion accessory protein CooC1
LELAKQLSNYNHVTFLMSANKIEELERKGLIATVNKSSTLDVVGLIDGNDKFLEIDFHDSQVNLSNIAKVCLHLFTTIRLPY